MEEGLGGSAHGGLATLEIEGRPRVPWRMPQGAGIRATAAGLIALLAGCERVEQLLDARREMTAHEAYSAGLQGAGLVETALGREWMAASREALASPQRVPLPYREEGFLAADDPSAVGLRVELRRGQVLTVRTAFDAGESALVFVDLFRLPEQPGDPLRPIVRVDSVAGAMVYEPYRDGEYLLRLQPELLRGGRYRVELTLDPMLSFPVDGMNGSSIGSGFGAPRDGGARDHHGVDIFADRGTPALAASPGRVTRVEETGRGGLVVWIRDERRSQNLYYAHLSRQLVTPGETVEIGDTVGLVGNTGNARTTPPHLHFGVYARAEGVRGPQDPIPYLVRPRRPLPRLPAVPERLGTWARVHASGAELLADPTDAAASSEPLAPHTLLRLVAGSGEHWRVRLPDGRLGWVATTATESTEAAVAEEVLATTSPVRVRPAEGAPVVAPLDAGARVSVLGGFGGYLWVRDGSGRAGWIKAGN
jgi:murein DD-endopeptidase MepM/ murein hydrolase activator NlpD